MTIKSEAKKLEHDLGGELADRVHELRPAQKKHLAAFVVKHGFIDAAQELYVNPAELEQCLVDTGHGQCGVCDEWFPLDDLQASLCGGCEEEV